MFSLSDHIKFLPHRDSRPCHDFNRRRLDGDPSYPTVLNFASVSSDTRSSRTALLIRLSIPIVCVRKLHKYFLYVVLLSGPLFVEDPSVSTFVIAELEFDQVIIVVCIQSKISLPIRSLLMKVMRRICCTNKTR